jgi:hypothetical protein
MGDKWEFRNAFERFDIGFAEDDVLQNTADAGGETGRFTPLSLG